MNLLRTLKGETVTVGLDIGTCSLKLVKVRHLREGYLLEAAAIQELPQGTIEKGLIKKRDALKDAVITLVNKSDPSIVEVVISMSGHGILSDRMTFKIEPGENAEELILWQASQRSPFDVDDITLDYKILRQNLETSEVEALIVAAKNQIMQNYIDLLYEAGIKPVLVDVDAFAITNCYLLSCGGQAEEGVVALINIGHDLTSVTFIKDGIYHSTRDISIAGAFFNTIVQRNMGIGSEEAAAVLKGRTNRSLDMGVLTQSIEYAAEELSSGIDLAFSYYKSSEKVDSVNRVVISGGGAYIPNLASFLEKRHETTVTVSNPLGYFQFDPGMFGSMNPESISSLLTVASGLALRKVAD